MLNPVTPIVLIFQRAIYAKLDNPKIRRARPVTQILPHWPMGDYLAYLGYSFVVRHRRARDRDPRVRRVEGELRRGALTMAAAIEVRQRLEALPALPRALHVAEGADDPLRADPVRGLHGARRHRLRHRAGHDGRPPRPQRLGQVDAAQVRRRDPAAQRRARSSRTAGSPRCSSSAPASTPSSPAARTST